MRRVQTNSVSQPVRNYLTNPSFETVGASTQEVRTNLCEYPNMSLAGAGVIVRTNLCTNPRGIVAFGHYNTAAEQTITANVTGFPANPDGFTTANRVAYSNGVNPGVALLNPVVSGTTYTVSAWIMHESVEPTTGTSAFAQAGVASSTAVPMTVGVWQKATWTYVASGTSQIGFRVSSASGGSGSFLITGVLFEIAGFVNTFFDGATSAAGDFTYSWGGAANASSSRQNAVAVGGWTNKWFGNSGGIGSAWQSTVSPYDGPYFRKQWMVANTTSSLDVGLNNTTNIPVTAGIAYTLSIMVRSSVAQHVSIYATWYDTGGSQISVSAKADLGTLAVDTWTRFSVTHTAPALATTAIFAFGPYTGSIAMPAGATLDFDQALIEQSPVLGTFFTGNFGAAGDFNYAWSGTVNASTSLMRGTLVTGIAAPFNNRSRTVSSTDWAISGTKSIRNVPTASTDASPNATYSEISASGLTIGNRYRLSGFIRLNQVLGGSLDSASRKVSFSGTAPTNIVHGPLPPNAIGVNPFYADFTAAAFFHNIRLYNGASMGNGDMWWDNLMVTEISYTGDYVDGTKPFSKWDGTAHASTSVGYPQQLADIAGVPIVDVTLVAPYTLDNSFGAQEGRTFYTVLDTFTENTGGVSQILVYGDNNLSDTTPNTFIQLREDTIAPAGNNLFLRRTGAMGVSYTAQVAMRHVCIWGINDLGQLFMGANGSTPLTDTAVTMSLLHQKLTIQNNTAVTAHIRTIGYRGVHDATTRQAMSRYLGNKYGALVA